MPIPENERWIARVNAAARLCGMSYGAYVALTGGPAEPPPDLVLRATPGAKFCLRCGRTFLPGNNRQIYCTASCRKAAYDDRRVRT